MMYPNPVLIVYCFFNNKSDAPPVYIEKQRSLKTIYMFILPSKLTEQMGTDKRRTKQSHKEPQKTAHFYGKSNRDCCAKRHTLQGKSIAIAAATHGRAVPL